MSLEQIAGEYILKININQSQYRQFNVINYKLRTKSGGEESGEVNKLPSSED